MCGYMDTIIHLITLSIFQEIRILTVISSQVDKNSISDRAYTKKTKKLFSLESKFFPFREAPRRREKNKLMPERPPL